MAQYNQYQTPQSTVDRGGQQEYGEVKVFSTKGRIGRVRFLAYYFGVLAIIYLVVGILAAIFIPVIAQASPDSAMAVIMPIYFLLLIVILTYVFTVVIRRCRDFNVSGWLSLVMLVPFVNFIFLLLLMIIPGTDGENNYGPKPPPNSTGVIIAAFSPLVLIVIMGILAAIAIPAYQGYIERAQQQQSQQLQQQQ